MAWYVTAAGGQGATPHTVSSLLRFAKTHNADSLATSVVVKFPNLKSSIGGLLEDEYDIIDFDFSDNSVYRAIRLNTCRVLIAQSVTKIFIMHLHKDVYDHERIGKKIRSIRGGDRLLYALYIQRGVPDKHHEIEVRWLEILFKEANIVHVSGLLGSSFGVTAQGFVGF